ncbi:ATP-binding protein [Peribacillus frigoritolerans]|nr:ATP-binding protein [Peribacillus frigoritolerans]
MVLSLINNLLANAVEAIEAEGYVSLQVKRKDQFVEFCICEMVRALHRSRRKSFLQQDIQRNSIRRETLRRELVYRM